MSIAYNPGGDSGGGGGGGVVGGSSSGTGFTPFLENGGFAATAYLLFVPAQPAVGGSAFIGTFSPNSWDDQFNPSTYYYRKEDVIVGRQPTVRRVILVHRDLGLATVFVNLQGTNDNYQVVTATKQASLGTTNASQDLYTAFVDITLTCFRPQLWLFRPAGGGPVSIVSATLIGEVEDVTL